MRLARVLLVAALAATPSAADSVGDVWPRIVEFVTDPQNDWNGDDRITPSDEFVEIHNPGPTAVDLRGWVLVLEDTTPDVMTLDAVLAPGDRLLVLNPPGALNNDGVVRLLDPTGVERDAVAFGSFDPTKTLPNGKASGRLDEAFAWNGSHWVRQHATPGTDNLAPFIEVEHDFVARADAWLAAPGSVAWLNATIVYAHAPITGAWLSGIPAATAPLEPGRQTVAAVRADVPATGTYDLRLNVATDTASWDLPLGRVAVDDVPPATPILPRVSPTNATSSTIRWPASPDDGVGGVRYDVETLRTTTPSRATHHSGLVDPVVTIVNLTHGESVVVRARAVDAFANASPWSEEAAIHVDHVPPGPVAWLTVTGRSETLVAWATADDDGTGVAEYEILRTWDGRSTTHSINATRWTDPDGPTSGELSYAVRARDAAGNAGPWTTTEADHEALHPHVKGVRVKKPVWSQGVQEIRIDFDRRMDASVPADVRLSDVPVEGRWFANATTFFVSLSSPSLFADGRVALHVAAAAPDGRGLAWVGQDAFRVDTTPPAVSFLPQSRLFEVEDAQDPHPVVMHRAWPPGEPEPKEYVPWEPGVRVGADAAPGPWTVRYWAVDDAGNRAPTALQAFAVPAADAPAGPPAAVTAHPPASASAAKPEAAQGQSASVEAVAERSAALSPKAGLPGWLPWTVGLAGLTSGGAWAVVRRHRAGGGPLASPSPSFAERLRRLRPPEDR